MKNYKIILSGGGTGGHIYPAISIANELKSRFPNAEFLFVGALDKMEMEKVPQAGYKIEGLWISGIQRRVTAKNLSFPFKLISSLLKSRRILKQFKPNTPGQRALVLVDKSDLYKGKPVKKLTEGLNKAGGRNNSGKITMWQRGGGHKRRYRIIDFKRNKLDFIGTVERIEYDPNRTAYIALIKYEDNEYRYIKQITGS